jgi:hypothetical protein
MAIKTATPKNGPRQLTLPSNPPSTGPQATLTPRVVSYNTMAPGNPPLAEPTITANEVAMNRTLPRPHPARNPTIWWIVWLDPATAENTTIKAKPASTVRVGSESAPDPPCDQHGHRGRHQVAGEQQLHLGRAGMQLRRQRRQDRVDEPDPHE